MSDPNLKLSHIRKIDNYRGILPIKTALMTLLFIVVAIWFFKGGSYRFYASLFFGLYYLTQQTWLSIILVGVVQTIIFLPFRFIGSRLQPDLKEFEEELEKTRTDNQYLVFSRHVREGNASVIFYMINFVLLALAFISVGRVFLLDFYNHPIDSSYLYDFIPFPQYPLNGTIFYFPFFKITSTVALDLKTIASFWVSILLVLVILRIVWNLLKRFLWSNKHLLVFRIRYNRVLVLFGGFIITLILGSFFFLRHIPSSFEFVWLSADLAKQNTAFNIITAIGTLFATIHAGYHSNSEAARQARKRNIPEPIVKKVFKESMYMTIRNGTLVSLFALWITHLMPCSHDLSVLSFEALYLISPFTFDKLVPKHKSA